MIATNHPNLNGGDTMNELLRRAVNLMRERSEAAPVRTIFDPRVAGVWLNSAHYLTVTPAVAHAVADWLEAIAPRFPSDFEEHLLDREQAAALAVARAYLGESA